MTRLSPGTLLLGVFAVLFGLIGAYAVKEHLRTEPSQPAPVAADRRQVVPLAAADLPAGRTLTLGDVIVVRMTPEQIANRGITREFMTNPNQVIGRTLREPVGKGEAFAVPMFYPEGIGPSVAARLKPGCRAVTIPLGPEAAMSGLVSPGSIVDVLFRTFADKKEDIPETTVTLLRRVEVVAIGPEMLPGTRSTPPSGRRSDAPPTVTLAVTSDQARALAVIEGRGTLSLVLCSPEEVGMTEPGTPQTLSGLLGLPKPEPPFKTDIYRRGKLTTSVFAGGQLQESRMSVGPEPSGSDAPTALVPYPERTLASAAGANDADTCGCAKK